LRFLGTLRLSIAEDAHVFDFMPSKENRAAFISSQAAQEKSPLATFS